MARIDYVRTAAIDLDVDRTLRDEGVVQIPPAGVRVVVVVVMAAAVVMILTACRHLRLAISEHHRFQQLAQRVLVQRHVPGQESGQSAQHQRLHRHALVRLRAGGDVRVVQAALEQVAEQLVQIAVQVVAASRTRSGRQRARVGEEPPVEIALAAIVLVEISAHR
jgi:hypothetical protein